MFSLTIAWETASQNRKVTVTPMRSDQRILMLGEHREL